MCVKLSPTLQLAQLILVVNCSVVPVPALVSPHAHVQLSGNPDTKVIL